MYTYYSPIAPFENRNEIRTAHFTSDGFFRNVSSIKITSNKYEFGVIDLPRGNVHNGGDTECSKSI